MEQKKPSKQQIKIALLEITQSFLVMARYSGSELASDISEDHGIDVKFVHEALEAEIEKIGKRLNKLREAA